MHEKRNVFQQRDSVTRCQNDRVINKSKKTMTTNTALADDKYGCMNNQMIVTKTNEGLQICPILNGNIQ